MPRLPRSSVNLLAAAAVGFQAARVLPGLLERGVAPQGWVAVLPSLVVGRLLLSLLPPGEVGAHVPSALPATLAVSAVLAALLFPDGLGHGLLVPGLLLVLLVARWLTLPGAMVPRHRVAREPWTAADALCVGTLALAASLVPRTPQDVLRLALCVCAAHALGVARRGRTAGYALVALGVLVPASPFLTLPAVPGLGLGAAFLVPWLRRGDRRAGVLCALGFGSVLPFDPLGAGPALVFVLASHARQRRFALTSVAAVALAQLALAALRARAAGGLQAVAEPRTLWGWALREGALDAEVWGLAWPIVVGALVLGALTFPWRKEPWRPGTIEEPRREALALAALLTLAVTALALPRSASFEQDVLAALFTPCALLAGLLLGPPERIAPPAAAYPRT